MNTLLRHGKKSGFTLVEMIVAIGLFAVVVTVAVGALLVLIATNRQLQGEQSVMTNLSFALDSMTREIRTGGYYFCGSTNSSDAAVGGYYIFRDNQSLTGMGESTNDCAGGNSSGARYHGVAIVEGGNSITGSAESRIVYYFDNDPSSPNRGKIMRRIGGETAQSIVSSGIFITKADFFVTGSTALHDGNGVQPRLTIVIDAKEKDDPSAKVYHIETTITQRSLDL